MPPVPAPEPGGPAADEVVVGAETDPRVTRVRQALADAGAEADVVVLHHVPVSAEDLAAQVGAPVGALVRCHLLLAEDVLGVTGTTDTTGEAHRGGGTSRSLLVLAAARRRLLLSEVSEAATGLGVEAVRRPSPDEVHALTGFAAADLPPVGLEREGLLVEAVLVDTALGVHEVLWVPAGRPGTVLAVGHAELMRLTLGHPVELA